MEIHLRMTHPQAHLTDKNIAGKPPYQTLPVRPSKEEHVRFPTWQTIKKVDPAADMLRHKERKQRPSLDATVRYADSYPEAGHRYGSHSSHDNFSDESGPDEDK
jgi:hypothetical protein